MAPQQTRELLSTYCTLCISRCGATAVLEDGRFIALKIDPAHPTAHIAARCGGWMNNA